MMKYIIVIVFFAISGIIYSQNLNDGLLIHYPFTGNANDISGNGLNGIVNATLTNDRFGNANQAYSFNGIDQYIDFPNSLILKPELPVSFSFWVKFDDLQNENTVIFTTDFAQNNHSGVWMNLSSGSLVVNYGDATGNTTGSNRRSKVGATTLVTNQWYHVVGIVKGPTDMEIFINCKNDNGGYQGSGGNLKYTTNPGSIGRKDAHTSFPSYYFMGSLDDFRYWNRELTIAEIESLCDVVPSCAQLTSPINGSENVSLNASLEWDFVLGADGYSVSIGTSTGGSDVLNNVDLGNVNIYSPTVNWEENTNYFVSIVAYNSIGDAINCSESTFTTAAKPNCLVITTPTNGSENVSLDSSIEWSSLPNADGYRISIGTSSGGSDVLNNVDLGNVNIYSPTVNWGENTNYFVRVTPYNSIGDAINCSESIFTTATKPSCTQLISPINDSENASLSSSLEWSSVSNTDGYRISIGTSSGGSDILDYVDLGNVNVYSPTNNWEENTRYFVRIVAYNSLGDAINCSETNFRTTINQTINNYLTIPDFFSPNNDGVNDYWEVIDETNIVEHIYIFDRYGKVLSKLIPNSLLWDGNYNGKPVQKTDYWYLVQLMTGEQLTGHFSLIRNE